MTNQAIQSLDNVNYSQYKDILKPFNESDEDEDSCNFDNLGFGINLPKAGMAAAAASLVSIKAMANVMGLPPEEIACSIPGLVNYMADNYLHFLEKSTDNVIKEVSADFGVQTEDLDKEQDGQFAFLGANSDMLNVIHQSVQSTIEALRTNKDVKK